MGRFLPEDQQEPEEVKASENDALCSDRKLRYFAENKRRNCIRQPALDSISENEEKQGPGFFEERQQSTSTRARKTLTLKEFITAYNKPKDTYLREQKRRQDAELNAKFAMKCDP